MSLHLFRIKLLLLVYMEFSGSELGRWMTKGGLCRISIFALMFRNSGQWTIFDNNIGIFLTILNKNIILSFMFIIDHINDTGFVIFIRVIVFLETINTFESLIVFILAWDLLLILALVIMLITNFLTGGLFCLLGRWLHQFVFYSFLRWYTFIISKILNLVSFTAVNRRECMTAFLMCIWTVRL